MKCLCSKEKIEAYREKFIEGKKDYKGVFTYTPNVKNPPIYNTSWNTKKEWIFYEKRSRSSLMLKKLSMVIIMFLFSEYIYSSERDTLIIGFPQQISDTLISQYVNTKNNLTVLEIKREYEYILNFLQEMIDYFNINIKNSFSENILNQKKAVIIEGKLGFFEERKVLITWDVIKGAYCEVANIQVIDEIMQLIISMTTYNQFVDHWFLLTGEKLRGNYDIDQEINSAILLFEGLERKNE